MRTVDSSFCEPHPPLCSLLPVVASLILTQNLPWEKNGDTGGDPHLGSGARIWVPAPTAGQQVISPSGASVSSSVK